MLQSIIVYVIKVIAISGLLLLYYMIALRNKRFHYYNRFYLLLSVLLSISLPLLHLQWFTFSSQSTKAIHLYNIINAKGEDDVVINGNNYFNLQQLIVLLVIGVSVILLSIAFTSIIKIFKLKRVYPVNKTHDFDFINTDLQNAPFSFLKNIFWRNDLNVADTINQQILQHEITHVQQKHSWDKLFIQFTLCFYWMNPFYWWLQKELNLIHEFIADEKAVKNHDAASFAKMLLATQYGSFQFYPAQSIFYSPIKRRLIMLTQSKKTQLSYLRRMMVLPLLAVVICLFAFKLNEQKSTIKNNNVITKSATNFKLVVDAGHGGKDYGAASNDLYEKDFALKIAEEIKVLSPQYGIDVVLTRDNDIYQTPQQKSAFANVQNANAFISIHINSAEKTRQDERKGFEVVIGKKEEILNNSKVLGSSIIQNLQKNFNVATALLQPTTGVWVLNNSAIPAALIECGYMTNANDIKLLQQDDKIEMIAKNILQGVAMYANNKVDTSNLYKLQNRDTVPNQSMKENKIAPLYIVDGKEITETEFKKIDDSKIASLEVWKDKYATDKYGEKGKNGVVEVKLKLAPPRIVKDTNFVDASFPGGNDGWKKYLENNLNTNVLKENKAPKGVYTVTVEFMVNEQGEVSDIKALKNPGFGTAAESVRIIEKGPKWVPATSNNQPIVAMEKQNISFQIN